MVRFLGAASNVMLQFGMRTLEARGYFKGHHRAIEYMADGVCCQVGTTTILARLFRPLEHPLFRILNSELGIQRSGASCYAISFFLVGGWSNDQWKMDDG
jgi:hypothetical protein